MANTALPWSSLAVASDTFANRATPMHYINGKSHNLKLESIKNYISLMQGPNHATRYSWLWGRTDRQTYI